MDDLQDFDLGLLSGKTLGGRFKVGKLLGHGGAGEVYEGLEQSLGRPVAIKVLLETGGDNTVRLQRLELEAKAAASLGHPNIVQVTGFFPPTEEEPAFLVMELLRGHPLKHVMLREGKMPPRRIAFIARQVLDALAATHRANIIHRDLKPENIFLISVAGAQDIVKLLDFGIAKRTQKELGEVSLTEKGILLGTYHYMSPEQITEQKVDPRTDIYSLGVVMYLALAATPPFGGPTNAAVIFSIVNKTPPPLDRYRDDLDEELVAVVRKAMAKNPEERFADADAMRAALEPWAPDMGG